MLLHNQLTGIFSFSRQAKLFENVPKFSVNGSEFKKIPFVFLTVYFLFPVRLQFLQTTSKRQGAPWSKA